MRKLYYCNDCGDVLALDDVHKKRCQKEFKNAGRINICTGNLEPIEELVTSKDIINHVSELQLKCAMLTGALEAMRIERDTFQDSLILAQRELRSNKTEESSE